MLIENFDKIHIPHEQRDDFERALKLKGVERYKKIEACLQNKKADLTYDDLNHHYRYDIKLRRALYKCIAFLEVSLKAMINNTYAITNLTKKNFVSEINNIFPKHYKESALQKRKTSIVFADKTVCSLFDYLENCDMGQMIDIFMLMPEEKHKELFVHLEYLEKNLRAAKEIRNAVFHHNLLMCVTLKKVYIGGQESQDLKSNIENIILLSPPKTHSNLKKVINQCLIIDETKGIGADNEYNLVEDFKIYFDGEGQ